MSAHCLRMIWLGVLIGCASVPVFGGDGPDVQVNDERVVLTHGTQRIVFDRDAEGAYACRTFVRDDANETWRPVFDAGRPLLAGADFDLRPVRCDVAELAPARAVVRLSGEHPLHGYHFDIDVEADAVSPLIRFRITCRIERPMTLRGLEPRAMLWMNRPPDEDRVVAVNQGVNDIYHGHADRYWGNSFPAAWVWADGVEAAVFLRADELRWMSHRNLYRFHDVRVRSVREDATLGLGMDVVKRNFHEIDPGELVIAFDLYASIRPDRPSELQGLDTLVRRFTPSCPSTAPWPTSRAAPHRVDWRTFADGTITDLMRQRVVWEDIELVGEQIWTDGPAFPDRTVRSLRVSTDYAVGSACKPAYHRASPAAAWDFSTCNNYLAGWIARERLRPSDDQRAFIEPKLRALPLFYDPRAGLIRHAPRVPPRVGKHEMAWQNFMFAVETSNVVRALGPDRFDPAIAGRFLMGVDGLIELAHNEDYQFPQWFDPLTKKAIVQQDEPDLGVVREPWQAGSYAWIMCVAYDTTGESRYLDEARAAVDALFDGRRFTVRNERYAQTYDSAPEYPVTEVFGSAWAVAASSELHRRTGEAAYRQRADDALNLLLRMAYWYESDLRGDAVDRAVRNAGLFRNHGGASTGSPWENVGVYTPLTIHLKHTDVPPDILLRMFNLYRINSFLFYPSTLPAASIGCRRIDEHAAQYLPIEHMYTAEQGGGHGTMGRAIYMSGLALWNDVMFEAAAVSDDREVMALNLDSIDGFEASVRGIERHVLVYNPMPERRSVRIRFPRLQEGQYSVGVSDGVDSQRLRGNSAEFERDGLKVALGPGAWKRITLRVEGAAGQLAQIEEAKKTANALAVAYRDLQRRAVDDSAAVRPQRAAFDAALADFRKDDHRSARTRLDAMFLPQEER